MSNKDKVVPFIYQRKSVSVHNRMLLISRQRIRLKSSVEIDALHKTVRIERRGSHENSLKNLALNGTGLPSKSSMKNLERCTTIFFMGRTPSHGLNPVTGKSGFLRAAFITFTIPDLHTVIDSKKGYRLLLNKMVKYVQYNFGVRDYIWKFEWQGRGQGHWHMFVDRFCEQDKIRYHWLKLLGELGLTKDFYSKHSFEPSSSCRVQGMRTEQEMGFYLRKYFSKRYQNEEATEGRLWGAALNIKKSKLPRLMVTPEFLKNLETMERAGTAIVKEFGLNDGEVKEMALFKRIPDAKPVWLCTTVKLKKVPVTWLLCPLQRFVYDQYIKAYRAGDWLRTWDLDIDREDVLRQFEEWSRWNVPGINEMSFGTISIEEHRASRKVVTCREKRNILLKQRKKEFAERAAGVSLFT